MKKLLSITLAIIMILSSFSFVLADTEVKIIINGKNLETDQAPIIVDGRTLVPMRAIFEGLGAKVEWDDAAKCASGEKGDKKVKITIGSKDAFVNGKVKTLDVPAQIVNSRTLVPVRFISESLGCNVDWDDATKTVIITDASEGKTLTFDDLNEFVSGKDYELGGGLKADKISLSTEFDHTTGNGKSLKIDGRSMFYHRVKLLNLIEKDYLGKEIVISAYVYYPDMDNELRLGTYSASGTAHSGTPRVGENFNIPKNTWTKVELTLKHDTEIANMIGFDQPNADNGVLACMYIDDINVKIKEEAKTEIKVENMENKRPVPTEFTKSKNPEDLIYYDAVSIDDIIPTLPQGEVMLTSEEFLNGKAKGGDKIAFEIVNVEGQEFDKAVRITAKEKTKNIYDIQYEIELPKSFEPGDLAMLVVSSRMISGGNNDTNTGGVQFVIEQNVSPWYKVLQQDGVVNQNTWTKSYMPFSVDSKLGKTAHMTVRVGHYEQVLEIGGVEIINYKQTIKQLPTTKTYEGQKDGAQWRKEALERIEKIRKGDFKLIIKDENGNVIPNANIKVDMTEHEFQWGTAVSPRLLEAGESGDRYRSELIKYFNGAVLENNLKWHYYEDDPVTTRNMIDMLKNMGIKYLRGHALVWDKIEENDPDYNSSMTPGAVDAAIAGDLKTVQSLIEAHIEKVMADFKDDLDDWDATNELFRSDTYIREKFGNDVVVEWFNMANKYNVGNAKIYMNEHKMVGTDNYLDDLVPLIEEVQSKGAKFDGIGVQAHFASPCYPPLFYNQLDTLAKYADELKITEFDFTTPDQELHASFVRDFLITIFSHEKVEGFFCWGFKDGDVAKYLLFDKNWNRKKAADQYEDLVYNKWWTNEEGTTNANGEFDVRCFYGNYDITVNVDGVEKTVNIPLEKANKGTVEVVIK
ncbi:MAG: hypothetical protein E7391_07175 [Ruminococcaceae bacterium]|nr:hypothetical protein [Oscillospiraceae bacterium]